MVLLERLHQLGPELVVRILDLVVPLRELLAGVDHTLLGGMSSSMFASALFVLVLTFAEARLRWTRVCVALGVAPSRFGPLRLRLRRHAAIGLSPVLLLFPLLFLSRRFLHFFIHFFLLILVDLFRLLQLFFDRRNLL